MRTDCSSPLCPLSPFSTNTLYCGPWQTGQSHSRRSRPMLPISWASIPTSSPTPPFDPSRGMSKRLETERARMMAYEGTGTKHTQPPPTIIPPVSYRKLNATLLPSTPTIPSSTIFTSPPWPWVQPLPLPHGQWFLSLPSRSCCPCSCSCPLILRQERQQTKRQQARQERQDRA